MLTQTHDAKYFERMASALNDKARIIDFLVPGNVLDVGAGDGSLSNVMNELGWEVTALEGSTEAVNRIHETVNSNVNVVGKFTYEMSNIFSENSFDNIVCSSIFHEIYSYGSPKNNWYSQQELYNTFIQLKKMLRPGGRLISRDGIIPNNHNERMTVKFTDPVDAEKFINYFRNNSLIWKNSGKKMSIPGSSISNIELKKESIGVYSGSMQSMMEFLYCYTWGWDSAPREIHEKYGLFTEEEYIKFARGFGFTNVYSTQYLQPGYPINLNSKATLFNSKGMVSELPSSNALFVFTSN